MNTFDLSLDLSKSRNVNPIRLRQGDLNGTTIRALVFDHGALADLSGTAARWVMRLPGGEEYYRKAATVDATACTVTVEVDETQAASVSGRCRGYFQVLDGSTVIASTGDVLVEVLPDALEGATVAESYDSAIQEAIDDLNDAIEAIPDTVEDVLEAHPEWTTTVQDGAVTDAKLYQGKDGILARNQRLMYRLDNLLTNALPEGDAATATDAAKTPLAGLSLYGRSTQDGTPTPEAPVPIVSAEGNLARPNYTTSGTTNGVAWTYLGEGMWQLDGTLNISTASARSMTAFDLGVLPAGDYTVACKRLGGTLSRGIICRIGTGDNSTYYSGATASGDTDAVFPLTADGETRYWATPQLQGNTVADGAIVAIMCTRGSVNYPYVPYGHAGLWARGKNLLWNASGSATSYGVTFTVNADGSVTCSGTATAQARFDIGRDVTTLPAGTYVCGEGTGSGYTIDVYKVVSGTATRIRSGFGTFTLDAETSVFVRIVVASGATVSATISPYIYRGTTATPYEPYTETVTPIDLDGHELRSLPDGTRDELTVGADGRVTLVQRVGSVDLGTLTWGWVSGGYFVTTGVTDKAAGNFNLVCDAYQTSEVPSASAMPDKRIRGNATAADMYIKDSSYSTGADLKASLDGVTMIYALATPQTIDLGWTDAIPLCGPDLVAQAVPAAPFALTYERDLNATLARLEAALAALA